MDRKLGGVTTVAMALAVSALIVFATQPSAEQVRDRVGARSCASFVQVRDASRSPPIDGPYPDLASYGSFAGSDDMKGVAGDRLDTFCRVNPSKTFGDAVKASI